MISLENSPTTTERSAAGWVMASAKGTESVKQIAYLAGGLKAPRITEAAARMADQARDAVWSFEDSSPLS